MNHFEARNEIVLLIDRADFAPRLPELFAMQRLNVLAIDPNFARRRPQGAIEQTEEGGLTCAARPDQGDALSFLNAQIDAVESDLMAPKDFANFFKAVRLLQVIH
jgi:hypothetical protein